MYGDIYEQQPTDWWGDPVEGQFITLAEFLSDLEQIQGCTGITIHMTVMAATLEYLTPSTTAFGNSPAAERTSPALWMAWRCPGGSLIMCACDTVKVNPSSLIMIHKCWGFFWGGYNADELREAAEHYDAWDKAQIAIYKRKTGLTDTVLSHMMADTTYMTGSEAVEKGFADELLKDAEPLDIAASADGRCLFVRGRTMHLTPGMFAPDTIPTVKSGASASAVTHKSQPKAGEPEGGNESMASTVEELRKEYPELTQQLEAEARAAATDAGAVSAAVQAEQKRIQEIDQVASLFDDETVREAKYGEKACTAQEMTYRAAQKAAEQGKNFLRNLEDDSKASGAEGVGAASVGEDDPAKSGKALTPEQRMANARAEVKNLFGKKEG